MENEGAVGKYCLFKQNKRHFNGSFVLIFPQTCKVGEKVIIFLFNQSQNFITNRHGNLKSNSYPGLKVINNL